jgi:hypothetical protein
MLSAHNRGEYFKDSNGKILSIGARVKFKINDRGLGGVGTGTIVERQRFLNLGQVSIKRDEKFANDTHATYHYGNTNIGTESNGGFYNGWTSYITILD